MENENLEPIGELKLSPSEKFEQCEWVFQFDEDEPQIFAWTGEDTSKNEDPTVTFTIGNTKNAYISFTNQKSNKTLKIFARELTEEGKLLRDAESKQLELSKQNLENDSENKEA
jgi:hypothetical protein